MTIYFSLNQLKKKLSSISWKIRTYPIPLGDCNSLSWCSAGRLKAARRHHLNVLGVGGHLLSVGLNICQRGWWRHLKEYTHTKKFKPFYFFIFYLLNHQQHKLLKKTNKSHLKALVRNNQRGRCVTGSIKRFHFSNSRVNFCSSPLLGGLGGRLHYWWLYIHLGLHWNADKCSKVSRPFRKESYNSHTLI